MQTLFEHQKRLTVPGTLHGTINQIVKAMFHAFVNAYTLNKNFYIVTEDTAFGDFDDLVIVTDDSSVTAIQYKHNKTVAPNSTITINDIITQGGGGKELMFHKYYQSLLTKRPQWNNEPNLQLELVSNAPIDQNLGACINPITKKFNEVFFTEKTKFQAFIRNIIIASILKHNGKLNGRPRDLEPYLAHIDGLLENHANYPNLLDNLFQAFKARGQNYQDDKQKIIIIKAAIKKLRDGNEALSDKAWGKLSKVFDKNILPHSNITHFDVISANTHPENAKVALFLKKLRFAHSEPNKDATISAIKEKLLQKFKQGKDAANVLYNSFFYYFMEWLGSEDATHISKDNIQIKFAEWQNRLLQLQRWIGISAAYQATLVTTIGTHQFERPDLITALTVFKKSKNRALVIYGERGMGKSTLLHQFIKTTQEFDSDYLMLNINTIFANLASDNLTNQCSFKFFYACNMIIIENCEDMNNYSEPAIKKFETLISESAKNIKFVFSFRRQNFLISNQLFSIPNALVEIIEIPKLDKELVIKTFPFLYALLAPNRSLTLYQKQQTNDLVNNLICHPFYLKLLVMYYRKNNSLNINFSSVDDFLKEILESLLTTHQLATVRRLIYLIGQNKETTALLLTNAVHVDELEKQHILVKEGADYNFSHKLYEEWALRMAIETRLAYMMESNDDTHKIYQEIISVLPLYQKEVYIYLGENITLREYRKSQQSIEINQNFTLNNNTYFLKILIEAGQFNFIYKNFSLLYVLVDSDSIGLLALLYEMVKINQVRLQIINNQELKQDFYTVLIRSFCISENMVLAGKLFYQTLQFLEVHNTKNKFDLINYMESFFVNSLAGCQSMGLMSFDEKLRFLKFHVESINSNSPEEEQVYFRYVYRGLVKAASPYKSGNASFAEHRCYFVTDYGNTDGYVNYQGKYFGFSSENAEMEAKYHCNAMRLLLNFYNRQEGARFITCEDALKKIIDIFKSTLASINLNLSTKLVYIVDVASIIASEIILDDKLFKLLNNYLIEKNIKVEECFKNANFSENSSLSVNMLFEPNQRYELEKTHIEKIQKILIWRKKNQYQLYDNSNDKQFLLSQVSVAIKNEGLLQISHT